MPYYIQNPINKNTCIGNSLSSFQYNFNSLDTNLFSLSGEMQFLDDRVTLLEQSSFTVRTQAQLISAFNDPDIKIIRLGNDITLTTAGIVLPLGKTFINLPYKLIQGGGATIKFYGECVTNRLQIFSGFARGEIVGDFATGIIYPEWWGMVEREHGVYPATSIINWVTPTNILDLHDDVAINCAVGAHIRFQGGVDPYRAAHVSLGGYVYFVAAPVDLNNTMCSLIGSGSSGTVIQTTTNWTPPVWYDCERWPDHITGNHSSVIWIGGTLESPSVTVPSYRYQIKGMTIACGGASYSYRDKQISGISSKHSLEELAIIDDVLISSFSGFGIGFDRHKAVGGGAYVNAAIVNGLTITNFWLMSPTKRTAVPFHFSQWTYNSSVKVGTIDMTLGRESSSAHTGTAPEWIVTYPLIGIVAQGNLAINNIHLEGMTIGIHVVQNSGGGNNVRISNIDCFAFNEPIRGAIYSNDGTSGVDFVNEAAVTTANQVVLSGDDDTRYFGYATGVLISKPSGNYASPYNLKDRVTIDTVGTNGGLTYLIRDAVYNKNIRHFGHGQEPSGGGGAISFYSRGNAYVSPLTLPYPALSTYDPSNPSAWSSTYRQYFIGPIY